MKRVQIGYRPQWGRPVDANGKLILVPIYGPKPEKAEPEPEAPTRQRQHSLLL